MKKIVSLIICSIIAFISFLSFINSNRNEDQYFSKLASANIEALANNESGTDHYWCCGNTETCASGPGYEIKGKFKEKPCN